MQYRKDKYGQDLSILGFGCMRFTRKGNSIDFPKAEEEIMEAFRAGVNYYDTAYSYPGSEVLLGTVLQRNGIRDQVKIATKLPQYLVRNLSGAEKFFREALLTNFATNIMFIFITDMALQKLLLEQRVQKRAMNYPLVNRLLIWEF